MAYVIVYHKDQEITRRPLDGAVTIGRSPECELSVHDILLSRKHCRIEPEGDGWAVTDLGSKNGTSIGGTPVFRLPLKDGDVIRMGKSSVRFRGGEMVARPKPTASGIKRPADPFEALAGTVTDFSFKPLRPIAPNGIPLPTPKPVPLEPAAYADEEVRSLVSQLVSSSWDSMYESASHKAGVLPRGAMIGVSRRKRPHAPRVDLSLQASEGPDYVGDAVLQHETVEQETVLEHPEALPLPPLTPPARTPKKLRAPTLVRGLTVVLQWIALAMLARHG